MYIDIEANDNLHESVMATFNATGPGRPVQAVRLHLADGVSWCVVTGWDESGPVPARWTPIEESGDGPAMLLTGGSWGLRLARIPGPEQAKDVRWSLSDDDQWAEGLLICTPETAVA